MTDKKYFIRKSLRLPDYDYAQSGGYFITICVQQKLSLFGLISDDTVRLNDSGHMIEYWWQKLPSKFPNAILDQYIIMPNHFHAILFLDGNPTNQSDSLSRILQWFKTMTTNAYIRGVKESSWKAFQKRLWQRNFFEQIIRSEEALNRIREYILYNPANWMTDDLYVE